MTWVYGFNKQWGCWFVSLGGLLSGGPRWIKSEKFEIQALAPEGSPTYTLSQFMRGDAPRLEMMLQTLMVERFRLVVHHETKERPVYLLKLGKGAPKLVASTSDDKRKLSVQRHADESGRFSNRIEARKASMRDLTFALLLQTHTQVIDETSISGEFNFDIDCAPLDDTSGDATGPSIFNVLQEQFGLKLETAKRPVEVLVIDHIERPTEN